MPNFDRTYPIAEAERGKFVPLTIADLTTNGMSASALSASRGRYALITYQLNSPTISGATIETQVPDANEVHSLTIAPTAVSAVAFTNPSSLIEIYNNSSGNNVYLYYAATDYVTLSAQGMIIEPGTYFSIEREATSIWVGADGPTSTDIRIFSHYTI